MFLQATLPWADLPAFTLVKTNTSSVYNLVKKGVSMQKMEGWIAESRKQNLLPKLVKLIALQILQEKISVAGRR